MAAMSKLLFAFTDLTKAVTPMTCRAGPRSISG
jgi:hypothetical protein